MKAVIYRKYGKADVLEWATTQVAKPKPTEIQVKVKAMGLNPKDTAARSGKVSILSGFRFPKMIGSDFSGVVVKKGAKVTGLEIGDEVFGYLEHLRGGALAEVLNVNANWVAQKPTKLSHEIAAAIPCAYLTALQGLRDKARLQKGQKLLIWGASGGVGIPTIQLAKHFGAEVHTISSSKNKDFCLEQGADIALGYDEGDFWEEHKGAIYDAFYQVFIHKGSIFKQSKKVLKPTGVHVTLDPIHMLYTALSRIEKGPRHEHVMVKAISQDLALLAQLILDGVLKPHIEKIYQPEQVQEAYTRLDSSHVQGKLVISLT
ncbi:MAG: NAD(P)-dependent alcohol dehydrogenase [Aureispira sp.]|nr:NAD(P)-dependent alcohol dehydrogenase [Aureispira sp.]